MRADGVRNDPETMRSVFAEVSAVTLPDGVSFNADGITTESITEDADYHGVRVHVPAQLAGARGRVQLDIGFGDVVTPEPQTLEFPVLLGDMSAPSLLAYSVETVVSEKFEAMISLSLINSRMKDFYDIHFLACTHSFDAEILQQAVKNTFSRRGASFRAAPVIFDRSFGADAERQRQWLAF